MKKTKTTIVKSGNDPIKPTKKVLASDLVGTKTLTASTTRKKSDNSTSYNTVAYHNQPVRKPLTSDAVVTPQAIQKRAARIAAAGPKNKLKPDNPSMASNSSKPTRK